MTSSRALFIFLILLGHFGAKASDVTTLTARDFRADNKCGLDLIKIYDTISELRQYHNVSDGPLTSVNMFMAMKDKLYKETEAMIDDMEDARDELSPSRLATEFLGERQARLIVMQMQLKETGKEIMSYFGIGAEQLAQIPGFNRFLDEKKALIATH